MSSPSGRGPPLRAGSPRCCNDRRPGSGSPHPPHGGGSPIRFGLVQQPEAVGPHSGRITRCIQGSNGSPAHQRGSPARSRHPRPDGLDRASWLRHRLHRLRAEGPRHRGTNGRGGLADPLLRASSPVAIRKATGTRHSIRLGPEQINPECAVREHNGQPCRPPLFPVCATREHVRPPALQAPLVRKSRTLQGGERSWLE
jgi:hypothetical protein